jgi:RimJ/RimL family protein N-acetyltransferase
VPDTSRSAPPVGAALEWAGARRPAPVGLTGAHVLLRPLRLPDDVEPLFRESHPPAADATHWTYLPYGPFTDLAAMGRHLEAQAASRDPLFFALVPEPARAGAEPAGIASLMRITPEHGVIEVGHIWLGASMRRTAAGTEAIYLLARYVFEKLGYRRFEWKCDALNAPSRRAAERLGFTFEGVFRQHQVTKGRNRDTAWYAMLDGEWPRAAAAFAAWLAPENFDAAGRQRRALAELRARA